ncbi:hypothetical protein [Kaistella palustris]|uniref:hypothetical protein n=1 Tax=Kaistella palustris TaxID=493376 RepID=UPI00042A0150|nr:hypothetical protein [Kaistella palustris]
MIEKIPVAKVWDQLHAFILLNQPMKKKPSQIIVIISERFVHVKWSAIKIP